MISPAGGLQQYLETVSDVRMDHVMEEIATDTHE